MTAVSRSTHHFQREQRDGPSCGSARIQERPKNGCCVRRQNKRRAGSISRGSCVRLGDTRRDTSSTEPRRNLLNFSPWWQSVGKICGASSASPAQLRQTGIGSWETYLPRSICSTPSTISRTKWQQRLPRSLYTSSCGCDTCFCAWCRPAPSTWWRCVTHPDRNKSTALHRSARSAPPSRLNKRAGTALRTSRRLRCSSWSWVYGFPSLQHS